MPEFAWPDGMVAAFSFTFDDARFSQVTTGLPLLEELGVHATFYVSPVKVEQRIDDWRRAVEQGHEIGNHTTNHPCSENYPFGREHALESYTLDMVRSECAEADERIRSATGITPLTFAYPCGQTYVGRGTETQSYVPVIAERHLAARCFAEGWLNDSEYCNLHQLAAFDSDGKPLPVLVGIAEAIIDSAGWGVFAGHEIGDGSAWQTTGAAALRGIIGRLKSLQKPVWIDTVASIARYVAQRRNESEEV